jgi:hypothetical protein
MPARAQAALEFCHEHHGKWLAHTAPEYKELPESIQGGRKFRTALAIAFNALTEAGLKPSRFIIMKRRAVRYLRADVKYEDVPVPKVSHQPKGEPVDTIDAGGWCKVEFYKNGRGRVVEDNRVLPEQLAGVFRHAVAHPLKMLSGKEGAYLFERNNDPAERFRNSLSKLHRQMSGAPYGAMFVAVSGYGTFFCPKDQIANVERLKGQILGINSPS